MPLLNSNEVDPAARLITDIIAKVYERLIRQHAHGDLLDLWCGEAALYLI